MTALYLYFNAALYAIFGLWCAVGLDRTSANLGYTALNNSGRSEYFTVYGGLQWGLGLIFLYLALKPELHRAGVVIAIALYAPIVLHRVISLLRFSPVERLTMVVAGLEIALLAAALLLWFMGQRTPAN